jgi:integrase
MTSDGRAGCTHDRRCNALILLSTFASPRRGDATALRRCDLDLDAHVRVRPAYAERSTGGMLLGPPKSKPGRRIVSMPDAIIAALREHPLVLVKDGYGARPDGGQPALRRSAHKHQISPLRAPEAVTAAIKIVVQNGSLRWRAKIQVALRDGLPASLRPRLTEFTAADMAWPKSCPARDARPCPHA